MNRCLRLSLVCAPLLLALGLLAVPAARGVEPDGDRIVAIGDVHGALDGMQSILLEAGLVDEAGSWVGGGATLVQLGDMMDRGTEVRGVMDFLMRLEGEAAAAGGRVVVLLGNHDVMNLHGELRDVTPEILATFATSGDEALRAEVWTEWKELLRRRASWRGEPVEEPGEEEERHWHAARPPGFFDYMETLGPEGKYGRWLRSLPTVVRLEDTLFLHGGISPEVSSMSVDEINAAVAQEIESFDTFRERLVSYGVGLPFMTLEDIRDSISALAEAFQTNPDRLGGGGRRALLSALVREFIGMRDWLSFSSEGPFWFRGYARWDEEKGNERITPILEAYGVERIVVAHSPPAPPSNIQSRFGGRVFLIDTGMREGHYPGGRPSALEIADGGITAIYEGERVLLGSEEQGPRTVASEDRAVTAPPERPGLTGAEEEVSDGATEAQRRWIGPDGEPLPLRTDEEMLDFLRHGEVLETRDIPVGVTGPKKLLLEKDGIRAHAIFRHLHMLRDRHQLAGGTIVIHFKDSHSGEPAAYELAQLLGLDTVPPAAPRRLPRLGEGSIQLWIEDAKTELDRRNRNAQPPDRVRFIRQLDNMTVFDNLVNNIDRNLGNILIGPDWKVWYIDCTRCFSRNPYLPKAESVRRIERGFWERLQALDERAVRERVGPFLGGGELPALMMRHARLVELIRDRIEELGEEAVLFSFEDDLLGEPLEMPEFPPATPETLLYHTGRQY